MIHETIDDCTFCEKEVAMPADIWTSTKLEYSDERSLSNQPRVIRVEFAGSGDEQVLVRRRSHDERRQSDSTLR